MLYWFCERSKAMKRKELEAAKAAGQTVAFVRYGRADRNDAEEVEVLDTEARRTVHGRSRAESFGRGHAAPGIRIRIVGSSVTATVPAVSLVARWSEYTKLRDDRLAHQATKQQRLDQSKLDAEHEALRVRALYRELTGYDKTYWYGLVEVGNNANHFGDRYTPPSRYHVTVAPKVLKALLDQISTGE
jgi:hypothetical protein